MSREEAVRAMLNLLRAMVSRLEKWPGQDNPEFFAEMKEARAILSEIDNA